MDENAWCTRCKKPNLSIGLICVCDVGGGLVFMTSGEVGVGTEGGGGILIVRTHFQHMTHIS